MAAGLDQPGAGAVPSRLNAILKQRCPRCLEGRAFQRGIRMHEQCPVCGLLFEREQGYFLAALYVAYGMTVPIMALFTLVAWLSGAGSVWHSFLISMVVFIPLGPWLLRYSRVIWMHLDRLMDPPRE